MKRTRSKAAPRGPEAAVDAGDESTWLLRLYVAGPSAKSATAYRNLTRLCESYMPRRYHVEVVDLTKNPQLAAGDQIVAVPTLVRKLPPPLRRIIGDLSDTERVLVGLDLRPQPAPTAPSEGGRHG